MPTKVLGPWAKGLNLTTNRNLSPFLDDHELGEATNIIYTNEGFVEPRPGCKVLTYKVEDEGSPTKDSVEPFSYDLPPGAYMNLVGNVDLGVNGICAVIQVVIPDVGSYVYRVQGEDDAIILAAFIPDPGEILTHLISHTGFVSDYTDPETGYTYPADTGVLFFTNIPGKAYLADQGLNSAIALPSELMIPASDFGMIVKDRLFLFDYANSKMHWSPAQYILDFRQTIDGVIPISDVAPFGTDFAGYEVLEPTYPGDTIRCVEFYNNNFYIFKFSSTFMFTYQLSPNTDGYLRKVSDDTGAYDSCTYQEHIIVINNKGVFRVEGTDFIDLQTKMNFRFEIPIDHPRITQDNIFICSFNNTILFGFNDNVTDPAKPKQYYYAMNTLNGAWSRWSYDYLDKEGKKVASPGSRFVFCKLANSISVKMLFTDFTHRFVVFMHWKPNKDIFDYHLDSNLSNTDQYDFLYFPDVTIKTAASFGDSMINYKKLYRYYIRFYLSEFPANLLELPIWTLSINYNDYKFNDLGNPMFGLYPVKEPFPDPLISPSNPVETAVYKRTYQVALSQQRTREFVFELKRRYSVLEAGTKLVNTDSDRFINSGYYFNLMGFWVDYQDKARV